MTKRLVRYALVKDGIIIIKPFVGHYSDEVEEDGFNVGNYEGEATEEEFPTYVPPEPPPVEPEYQTLSIRKTQWRSLFDLGEQILSDKVRDDINGDLSFLVLVNDGDTLDSPHPLIPSVTYRDILRTGFASFGDTNTIDVTDSTTVIMVNTFYLVGILPSQERVDTILKGVPQ